MQSVKSVEKIDACDYIITTEITPCWFFRLFGFKPYEVKYRGDCTYWSEYPSGDVAGLSTRVWLSSIWQQQKWKEKDSARG